MYFYNAGVRVLATFFLSIFLCLSVAGCTMLEIVGGVTGGTTAYMSSSPSTEIEQIYYLGVFDPQEQVPPTVYRVRVHGQASALSGTKFASGWVKSEMIDSLGTNIKFGKDDKIQFEKTSSDDLVSIKPGHRLMLFGPEGFREAPEGQRLVIVMGSSPEKFFAAIDESLGMISKVQADMMSSSLSKELFEALSKMDNESSRLQSLSNDIKADLPDETAGGAK